MKFLFVHQNFPGQFRHVVRALGQAPEHQVVGMGDARHIGQTAGLPPAVSALGYPSPRGGGPQTHPYLKDSEAHLRRGQQVFRGAMRLKAKGFVPDVVVVHPGWGEGLFLREAFPQARHIHYCEYFYHSDGADVGFDPEFPAGIDDRLKVHYRNGTQLLGLVQCDAGISPTPWQRSLYPADLQSRISVLHEGIDTALVAPDPHAVLSLPGTTLRAGDEVVTFVARNLEPYRGFHSFMRALPLMQQLRPSAHVVVVGGDDVSYGRRLPDGQTYRQKCLAELEGRVDLSRVHFPGKLPYLEYLKVLQVSAAHVYLTYPFVLSWSMLEAMAAGCLIIGSDTAPVRDVITDRDNGLLVDFFDTQCLARTVAGALAAPHAHASMRARARSFIEQRYDLRSRCLPAWLALLTQPPTPAA